MPNLSPIQRERAGKVGLWFGLLFVLVFCGEGLGYAAWELAKTVPPSLPALFEMAGVAAVVGGVATVLLNWLLLDQFMQMAAELGELRQGLAVRQAAETQLASRVELQRRLRHDLRGALSPALLTADRLITHEDPRVRRAGEIMVRSVDRAASLLADPADANASPPADP